MEKATQNIDQSEQENSSELEHFYHSIIDKNNEENILTNFTPEQQEEIQQKQKLLSSLAYFIGKDFNIPVELNQPGAGWHWDFKNNIIRVDPKDLLEKSMDYLRFVISHEGGHKRVSRTDFIPLEIWTQPGFSYMMNCVEDARDNNFVAESYPKFREQMQLAYRENLDLEEKSKEKAIKKIGHTPRFMIAGFEYIKQWFREIEGQKIEIPNDLPSDVKKVVKETIEFAKDSWLTYPSREEADAGEEIIKKYSKASYQINNDKIWPIFKKLVEADIEDQKVLELLKELVENVLNGAGLPQDLKDKLTEEEQEALVSEIMDQEKKNSDEIKQKIKKYFDGLSPEKQKEITEKARSIIKELEKELDEELASKLSDDPEAKMVVGGKKLEPVVPEEKEEKKIEKKPEDDEELKKYKDLIAKELKKEANIYEKVRQELLPIIDMLETDLREIFVARKLSGWKSGFETGKKIDIKRRIQEKAKSISPMESKAWQKREAPKEKDYAISLLVDLSGSMYSDGKIIEAFKSLVVLSEVLNRLSIKIEILGFNDQLYEYQKFTEQMSPQIREKMGGMIKEVETEHGAHNDDGWAIESAAERLEKQKVDQKFLITLSDGQPAESRMHPSSRYDLSTVINKVMKETDIKLIGLGIGNGTGHVSQYYPNSIANVKVEEMAKKLAELIKEVIANYDKF